MKKRVVIAFWALGVSLILLALCLTGVPLALHKSGAISGWSGFGLFVIGLKLGPWMLGFALQAILLALILNRTDWKSRSTRIAFSVVLVTVFLLGSLFAYQLPRMFPTESTETPRELMEGIVRADERFLRQVYYRQPDLGVITDIAELQSGQLAIVGRRGTAVIDVNGTLINALSFDPCLSDVALMDSGSSLSFLCRGDYGKGQTTRLIGPDGKTLWSFNGDGRGVFDAAVADVGNGAKGVVVGLYGDGGLRMLNREGKEVWRRKDNDVWHVEAVGNNGEEGDTILHSNGEGQLITRNRNGDVVSRVSYPRIILGRFSITPWGSGRQGDNLIVSHFDQIEVLGMDGSVVATFAAPMHGPRDPWTTYGIPVLASPNVSYYAILQRYDEWNRSLLRLYDEHHQSVYEEVIAGTCASLRTLPDGNEHEALLVGCDGTLFKYTLGSN